jgi:hypothetical protein
MPYSMLPFENYPPYPPAAKPVRSAPPVQSRPAPAAPRPAGVARVGGTTPDTSGITSQHPPVTVPPPGDLGITLDRP